MSKNDIINIMNGPNLIDKKGVKIKQNKAKVYYKNNKEKLREQARDKYTKLSEEKKRQKRRIQ